MKNLLKQTVDMILPPRCIVTGEIVGRQGMISGPAFAALDFIAPPYCSACGLPFAFATEGETLCLGCLEDRPAYGSARSVLHYNDSSRGMILGFKHVDQTHAVSAFVPWMMRVGGEMIASADVIVPVPLHRWRLLSRRYNQAMILTAALSKATGVPNIPDLLARVRATPSQGHLRAGEREKNVAKAFALNGRYTAQVRGKNILLIDDVYTTGATVKECARVLLKSGAAKVNVLTLARAAKL
ncbi:MAG: ComF family protein [Alphaproteobacteria bacterium]